MSQGKRRGMDRTYDAVVVGAGNGGLAAALTLAVNGVRPLLLEQHNIPGGFATSFVRGRFEFEVSLHELSNVGPDDNRGSVRLFLEDEANVHVDWARVPEAYRLILTEDGINAQMPFGVEAYIDAMERAVPGSRESVTQYLTLCAEMAETLEYLATVTANKSIQMPVADLINLLKNSDKPMGEIKDVGRKISNFIKSVPRTVEEVTRGFNIPPDAMKILSPYWCYLGIPMNRLDFTIWAAMLMSYLTQGAYVPRLRSQEMTIAIENRIRELGGHVEFNTRVERIMVEKGRVTGIETSNGDVIKTDNVICNASPTLTFNKLICPQSEVPEKAMRFVNARKYAASGLVVYLGLDAGPEELGITDYGYFISPHMDTEDVYNATAKLGPTKMQAATCLNMAVPDCSPPGTSVMCLTILHQSETWKNVAARDYHRTKDTIARQLIEQFESATGVDLKNHIEEIETATPATFYRYTGSYLGGIYGYEPDPWDSVIPKNMTAGDTKFIKGLEFAGGFAVMGHGYSVSLLSGRAAALTALKNLGVGK